MAESAIISRRRLRPSGPLTLEVPRRAPPEVREVGELLVDDVREELVDAGPRLRDTDAVVELPTPGIEPPKALGTSL